MLGDKGRVNGTQNADSQEGQGGEEEENPNFQVRVKCSPTVSVHTPIERR